MTRDNIFEALVGGFVVLAAAVFFLQSYQQGSNTSNNGYAVKAVFSSVDGLNRGADVRVAGVKIGSVESLQLEDKSYRAVAVLKIDPKYQLPLDSSAKIAADGLLGGSHVKIEPGSDNNYLVNNEEIEYTQGSVNLTDLIAKSVFGGGNKNNENNK